MYEAGLGVARDYNEALKWYRASAEQGEPVGQSNLAFMYAHSQGVRRDFREAARWSTAASCRKQSNLPATRHRHDNNLTVHWRRKHMR